MPRRQRPDPLAKRIGSRIRALRTELGLTLEKLAYEIDAGPSKLGSKGYLSDIERGLARPTVATLDAIAERLGVRLFDLFTFPEEGERERLVDQTRRMSVASIRQMLREGSKVGSQTRPRR